MMDLKWDLRDLRREDIIDGSHYRFEQKSEKKFSFIEPIFVCPEGKKFRILSGFKRFDSSKAQDLQTIPSLVLLSDLSEWELLKISCVSNPPDQYSEMDRAKIMHFLIHDLNLDRRAIVKEFASVIGVDPNWRMCEIYSKLWRLPSLTKQYIETMQIGVQFAEVFLLFSEEEQAFLIKNIFKHITPTRSEFRLLAEDLTVLKHIQKTTLESLFSKNELSEIFDDSERSIKEKTAQFLQLLKSKRSPVLHSIETKISQYKKIFPKQSKCSFVVPNNFENDNFEINMKFKNSEDLEKRIDLVRSKVDSFKNIDKLLDV